MPRISSTTDTKESKETRAARAIIERNARGRTTSTAPVRSRRHDFDAGAHKVGQDRPRVLKSTGPARQALESATLEVVETPVSKDKLEALAFNEEVLTVMIADSTNPVDEPFPEVWVDGRVQRFQRGLEMAVKRKYVEVLARAKKTAYTQQKFKDAEGNDSIRNVPHTALRYPFSVIHDPNPRGRAWLKAILEQA